MNYPAYAGLYEIKNFGSMHRRKNNETRKPVLRFCIISYKAVQILPSPFILLYVLTMILIGLFSIHPKM